MKNYKLKINGNSYQVDIKGAEDNIIELEVNGSLFKVEMEKEVKATKTPRIFRADPKPTQKVDALNTKSSTKKIEAPLPGVILEVLIKEGQEVSAGDKLLVLEAMKMENNIVTDVSGKVKSLNVKPGNNVLQGDVLMEIV